MPVVQAIYLHCVSVIDGGHVKRATIIESATPVSKRFAEQLVRPMFLKTLYKGMTLGDLGITLSTGK
jgi:hypothetical protein